MALIFSRTETVRRGMCRSYVENRKRSVVDTLGLWPAHGHMDTRCRPDPACNLNIPVHSLSYAMNTQSASQTFPCLMICFTDQREPRDSTVPCAWVLV
jgi:hypothetical protein